MKEQSLLMRVLRYRNNLSQKELAEICGYETPQFISNIERGLAGIPLHVAKLLAKRKLVSKVELKLAMLVDYKNLLNKEL